MGDIAGRRIVEVEAVVEGKGRDRIGKRPEAEGAPAAAAANAATAAKLSSSSPLPPPLLESEPPIAAAAAIPG